MQWAAALSTATALSHAFDQVSASIEAQLGTGRPDLVFAFATSPHHKPFREFVDMVGERWAGTTLVGCGAGGVLAEGREIEQGAGLAISAAVMPGVELRAFHFTAETLPRPDATAWREALRIDGDPHFVVLPDPFTFKPDGITRVLDDAFPDAVKVGALASGFRQPGGAVLVADEGVHGSGVVGIALAGNVRLDAVVCQGCRPIGTPLFVTRAERNVIHELDGRRPAEVIQELYDQLPAGDRELLRRSLFIGLVMNSSQEVYRQGDFLVRNIVGLDTEDGSLAIAAEVQANAVVQFHLRDADTSASDIETLLGRYVASPDHAPAGALLFSCLGRGRGLYGEADFDSRAFGRIVGPVPLGGFFGNGELGPVGGSTHLHGYTSSFGLFSPKMKG